MTRKTTSTAKFVLESSVRVRYGVKDPDFPDIPIGGWVGKITEVEEGNSPIYHIRWTSDTLKNMHPVDRNRCKRDGLNFEEMQLGEDDLELDAGGTIVLEPPTTIITPPLSMSDQDDRIRAVFGLTRDNILPEVNETSLRTYHNFLVANLTFPFTSTWSSESRFETTSEMVAVHGLNGFDDDHWCDDTDGIMCQAKAAKGRIDLPLSELEKVKGKLNSQIVADYRHWFWNH